MLDHFEEEEVVLVALARKYMSHAQYDNMIQQIQNREMQHGLRGLAWIMRTAGHGPGIVELRQHIPCFILLLHDCYYMPNYLARERRWIESVYEPSTPRPTSLD